jgi:isopenicillin-N N-acyltransferase-like protein
LLTVTGCLGMAGMNASRVGDRDQQPLLDRRDARRRVAGDGAPRAARGHRRAARDVIVASPIGSGHHYFVADRNERSRSKRRARAASRSSRAATESTATRTTASTRRSSAQQGARREHDVRSHALARARSRSAPLRDLDDAWQRLGSEDGWPRSICTNMATPERRTARDLRRDRDEPRHRRVWAQQGFVHNVAAEKWQL